MRVVHQGSAWECRERHYWKCSLEPASQAMCHIGGNPGSGSTAEAHRLAVTVPPRGPSILLNNGLILRTWCGRKTFLHAPFYLTPSHIPAAYDAVTAAAPALGAVTVIGDIIFFS